MLRLLIFLIFLFHLIEAFSQQTDSIEVKWGSVATLASNSAQPFWIYSNRSGTISDQKADISTHLAVFNKHPFPLRTKFESHKKFLLLDYGFDFYSNDHLNTFFFKEAFIKFGYHNLQLRAGRYESTTGEADPELSSGSFGISRNALPIPKAGISIPDFQPVPFTNQLLKVKGNFEHGWLGKTKNVKNAYLHEKSLYIKLGTNLVSVHGGITHFAQWGGKHASGQAPARFKDFTRILLGNSGDTNDSVYHRGPIDNANAVGNHLLISDFGLQIKIKTSQFKIYTQTIFEKGSSDSANQRDKLEGLKILGKDRIVGISWENKALKLLSKVVIEGIYTKHQGGPVVFKGRDNYYNNATYSDGWEYKERIIGSPLFINKKAASGYSIKDGIPDYSWNIVSNRLLGFHLALKGRFDSKWSFRSLITHLRHYGNYYNTDLFNSGLIQTSLLFENNYLLTKNISLSLGLAQDFGDLAKNTGAIVKFEWTLLNSKL